jgi:flagellar capping protein FliD
VSTISFSGVGTGIDWNAVIQAQVQARTQQIVTPLQNSQTSYQSQISAYDQLGSLLNDLQTSVEAMDTAAELRSYTATSSADSSLSAVVSSSATPGSHSVVINQLATAEVEAHGGVDDASTVLNNTGSSLAFAYSYAGKATTVTVASGTTLQQLVGLINNDPNNPGVTASLLDDGSGSSTSHHLILQGIAPGAANTIQINASGTTLAGDWANLTADATAGSSTLTVDSAASFHQYQAVMVGDDDSAAETHVIDSIAGTTLTLKDALSGDFTTAQNAYVTPAGSGSAAAAAATAGTAQITVADASPFRVGRSVIIADANGSEELTISSIDSGTGTITFSSNLANNYAADAYVTQEDGGGKFTFADTGFSQVQAAANAEFRVDGYPPSTWLQRSSNVVTDVIPGVTLTLNGTNAGAPVTVTVNPDVDGVKEKINQFVTSFNAVKSYLNANTAYDAQNNKSGVLQGSYAAVLIEQKLQDIIVNVAPGFLDGTDAYTVLGQVGINTVGEGQDDSLGTLSVDDTKLTDALNANFDAVIRLFSANFGGYSDSQGLTFYQASSLLTTAGTYDVQADFDSSGNLIAARIKGAGQSTYRDAVIDPPYLYGQAGGPDAGLWVKAQWDGASTTQSATIRVTQGKAGQISELISQVLDPSNGLLTNAEKNDQDVVNGLQDRIDAAQQQLNDLSDQLRSRYARLEDLLVEMQGRQQWITNTAASLGWSG